MRPRLLTIDDDDTMVNIVNHIASEAGFITSAATGVSTQDVYASFRPDVIVLDILMPEKDGFEILQHLNDCGCKAHIILLSGSEKSYRRMAENLGKGLKLKIVANIPKPIEKAQFRYLLEEVLHELDAGQNTREEPPKTEEKSKSHFQRIGERVKSSAKQ